MHNYVAVLCTAKYYIGCENPIHLFPAAPVCIKKNTVPTIGRKGNSIPRLKLVSLNHEL